MTNITVKTERCKECGLCIEFCPRKCISLSSELNNSGYHFTVVDKESCIGCGSCYTVCPDGVYTILSAEGNN